MKRNKKHESRVKKLVVACGLCAIILTVSTYAWFIGMKTVNVSAFDVEIAAIDGLKLSLDGETWSDTVTINDTNFNSTYDGNTNIWTGGKGLIPMSSVGVINTTSSRLTMYEKGSFTPTSGGYRIMASEVQNSGATEANGYVAFDLFIQNKSGNKYYTEVDRDNEEAVYLTPESKVDVAAVGLGKADSGIENSVRVAFAQIGRVKVGASAATIQGITCTDSGEGETGVLGICDDRTAQIWEPNDTKHVANAIKWYTESCKKRTGEDVFNNGYGTDACAAIVDGTAYPTYAISGVIDETSTVDNYDGTEYNTYTNSIVTSNVDYIYNTEILSKATEGKLLSFPYFTDTMKDKEGTERPTFMTLAPNSVTKVRVYVYLEGQDVDNYDFASLGEKIKVAFGFTKERFYGDDINYTPGPELPEGLQSRPATATQTQ